MMHADGEAYAGERRHHYTHGAREVGPYALPQPAASVRNGTAGGWRWCGGWAYDAGGRDNPLLHVHSLRTVLLTIKTIRP